MLDNEVVVRALHEARAHGMSFRQLADKLHLPPGARGNLRDRLLELIGRGRVTFDGQQYRAEVKSKQKREPPRKPERGRDGPAKAGHNFKFGSLHKERHQEPAAMAEGARRQRDKATGREGATPKGGREVVGILHVKPEGYGFVTPLTGGARKDDLFLPPHDAQRALDGDVVRVRVVSGRDGRMAAQLIEVVEQRRRLLIGTWQTRGKQSFVVPHDRGLSQPVQVPKHREAHEGDVVKVRLDRASERGLAGEVIEVLGPPGDPRFEMLAALYANGFSDEFDAATLREAERIPEQVRPDDLGVRRDLRKLPLVTIDGEDARDFDDAVHASRVGSGYRLVVAIADVAHYVRPDTALDREGLRRSTSVYFPGRAVAMLPERLSNGICSLNPKVDRLCMVCDLALDAAGNPVQADLYEAVMNSHARLTYTSVAEALAGKPDSQTQPLLEDLQTALELSKKLTERRKQRGSIDFDLPEAKIVLNDDGTVKEIVSRPRNDAHKLIEEFMLAANEAVARFFDARGLPTVYRIHDAPDEEKLAAFAQLARTSGVALDETKELTPLVLNNFLAELEGKPQQRALHSLLLRAMMQAQYSPDNIGHYGLAAPTYLHFTSPIRRYPDLMVHRLLKEHWARAGEPLRGGVREEVEERLAGVSAQCSERERASMKAERDIDAFYAALFMVEHVGERHDAVVSGLSEGGLFCALRTYFVEGMVRAEGLGTGARLDEERHRLVIGSSGESFGVGDELVIDVLAADPQRRRIELGFVEKKKAAPATTEVPAKPEKPKKKERRRSGRRE